MPKTDSKKLKRKKTASSSTSSKKFKKAKLDEKKKGNQAALDSVGKKQQCVVLLKRIKSPIDNISQRRNGTQSPMDGNIKLRRCFIKLAKDIGSQSPLEKQPALFAGSTVPQTNGNAFTKKCEVKIKRMKKEEEHLNLAANNSNGIELPRSTASPLLSNDFGVQLGNLINKSNTTQQNTQLEPICLQDSCVSTKINAPLNESVIENGHAMTTNQSIPNDHQSPVHILNNVNDRSPQTSVSKTKEICTDILNNVSDRSPQTSVSKTEESSENYRKTSHGIAEKIGRAKSYKLTTLQKQRKFFNRTKQILSISQKSKPKTASIHKRKSLRNVYDFLSQSQNSDQEKPADPAADIIKQMIIDGKVVVTKSFKGRLRCKPTQSRAKKVRPVGKRKQCSLVDINKNMKNVKSTETPKCLMVAMPPSLPSRLMSPVHEADDVGEADIFEPEPLSNHSHTIQMTKANDSSMNLARSVLMNESSKSKREINRNERQKLLDVARKFVSTPVNKKLTNIRGNDTLNKMNLSPIAGPAKRTPQLASCKSPWRVPDDVILPNTFVFGRNSSDLPSFSSDFMSKSPRKQISNNKSLMRNLSLVASTSSQKPRESESFLPSIDNHSIPTIRETFQQPLNNSNGENLPPKSPLDNYGSKNNTTRADANDDDYSNENQENDENFLHLPNPRRTIQNRSPLKKINVLDVITLPSWKNNINKMSTKDQMPTKTVDDALANDNFFGFDEFLNTSCAIPLDSDDIERQNTSKNLSNSSDVSNKTLQELYQNLEDILPPANEMPKLPTKEPMRHGYDEGGARQQDLREMFCSTMINQNKTLTDGGTSKQTQPNDDAIDETNNLFRDPETTFNNKQPVQTYGRPVKRVRKVRHEFLMFEESDVSDEEEERGDACDKKPKSPKRKKHRSNKESAELKEFVTSFNEMCKDVENYELVVE